jgi:hypothetical protein
MKLLLAAAFITLLSVCNAHAQKSLKHIGANDAIHHFNESLSVGGLVRKFRVTPDSAVVLMGDRPRKTWVTVVLKDSAYRTIVDRRNRIIHNPRSHWHSYPVHAVLDVTGIIRNVNGRPYMVISDRVDEIINPDIPANRAY